MVISQTFPQEGQLEEAFAPPLRVVKLEVPIASPFLCRGKEDQAMATLSSGRLVSSLAVLEGR